MKTKKIVTTMFLALSLYVAPVSVVHAGIPMIDGAHIVQSVITQIETIEGWIKQAEDMKAQYDHYRETLEAMKGKGFFKDVALTFLTSEPDLDSVEKIFEQIEKHLAYKKEMTTEAERLGCIVKKDATPAEKEEFEKQYAKRPMARALCLKIASQGTILKVYQARLKEKQKKFEELAKKASTKENPGEQDEIQNAIAAVQADLKFEQDAAELTAKFMKTELAIYQKHAQGELRCRQFNSQPKRCVEVAKNTLDLAKMCLTVGC